MHLRCFWDVDGFQDICDINIKWSLIVNWSMNNHRLNNQSHQCLYNWRGAWKLYPHKTNLAVLFLLLFLFYVIRAGFLRSKNLNGITFTFNRIHKTVRKYSRLQTLSFLLSILFASKTISLNTILINDYLFQINQLKLYKKPKLGKWQSLWFYEKNSTWWRV